MMRRREMPQMRPTYRSSVRYSNSRPVRLQTQVPMMTIEKRRSAGKERRKARRQRRKNTVLPERDPRTGRFLKREGCALERDI